MLVRVRSNVGVWRVDDLNDRTATVSDVLESIALTRPHVVYERPLSFDPSCSHPLDTTRTLAEQRIRHGDLIHCRVDPATTADVTVPSTTMEDSKSHEPPVALAQNSGGLPAMRRIIDKDGQIKLVPTSEVPSTADKGFRKGMLPLRDMKMSWTLNDFIALDAQFVFKIQRQEQSMCAQVSLNTSAVADFQAYLQKFQFQQRRYGFLYGTVDRQPHDSDEQDNRPKVKVEAIYEPPQQVDPDAAEGYQELDDPNEEAVEQIAQWLGWKKVGWIFGHEPREPGWNFSSAEIIAAAEYQLEAASGVNDTPFVTIKVTQGEDGLVSVEAFQVSQQCMSMVAEEALEIGENPKQCVVNDTFTAIQEGKESKNIENDFFLTVVPIVQHTSETFVTEFPKLNREFDERVPSHDALKRQLSKAGQAGWTFEDRLADFHLLLYISRFLDLDNDMAKICQALRERDRPLDDGYKLILKSMAGMQGSY